MTSRQQQEIAKIDEEINQVSEQVRVSGEYIDLSLVEEHLKALDKRKNIVKQYSYFTCDYIFPAIAYLVSLIEGRKFVHKEVTLPTFNLETLIDRELFKDSLKMQSLKASGLFPYKLSFLCEEDAVSEALKDINERIEDVFNSFDSKRMFNEILLFPSENYVQLTFYRPTISLEFNNNLDDDDNVLKYKNNESKIVDDRYLYIIDFMDYLTDICMTLGRKLSGEEMMMYAEEFARRYNLEKEANTRK